MGRKYYCDYCDKRIQNDYRIIKQHNEGLPHLRAKAEHFQQFKGIEEILLDVKYKTPCRSLKDGSECMFGVLCRYRHYTTDQIWEMQQLAHKSKSIQQKRSARLLKYLRNVESRTEQFLQKRFDRPETAKLPPSMCTLKAPK
uniref:Zinc finger matrin-type protein 5 n=1 Tax=Anopheles dirus TaxID=7168 RepID=A0A182N8T7_9DIPT